MLIKFLKKIFNYNSLLKIHKVFLLTTLSIISLFYVNKYIIFILILLKILSIIINYINSLLHLFFHSFGI